MVFDLMDIYIKDVTQFALKWTGGLPIKHKVKSVGDTLIAPKPNAHEYEEYADMTKEELIREFVKARITQTRLKKDTKGREMVQTRCNTRNRAIRKVDILIF